MTSPYGPSGGNDPQQQPQWGQQPPQQQGGGYSGTPSGGFPAQNPYGQPDPTQQQQPQWGQLPPHEQATQVTPQGNYDPNAQQQPNPYAAPQQPQGGYDPTQQVQNPYAAPQQGGYDPTQQVQSNPYGMPQQGGQFGQQQNPYGTPPQGGQYGQQNPYGQQQNPYGQQQNPYGQPDPYGQKPKKSSAVLWVVVALVVLVAAAVGITGFVAPGFFVTKKFDNVAVQGGVVGILKDTYKIPDVESATCPADKEVKVGATFDCTVQVGGNEKKVKITVKTADGEYEVGQPTG
jgi:hypothetical protein